MENILLLTDFSDLSTYARSLADKVARHTSAELHVLKVVHLPSDVEISTDGNLLGGMSSDLSHFKNEMIASQDKMNAWTSKLKSKHLSHITYGRLLETTHKYIQENNIELVIMGTHGVSGLQELISGSVTEHLILNNSVPVLSLKCERENIDFSDFLITGAFEQGTTKDLEVLKALQKVFNSNMHLLWVNTKSEFTTSVEAMQKMREFAQSNNLEKTQFHIYNDKTIEDGIVNFSNNYDATHELDIDVIAVEKKQKSKLGYMMTGCQATSFVNHIFKPIITYTKG